MASEEEHPPGSRAEYDAMKGENWSKLSKMNRSPKHYRWAADNPDNSDSPAFLLGRVLHMAVLEPEKLKTHVAVWGGATRAGKKWEAFCSANPGMEILTVKERDRVAGMAAALLADPYTSPYLQHPGPTEHSIQWRDPLTQQLCKARLDKVAGRVVEVKSSRDASPYAFASAAFKYLYHGQAAYYHDGLLLAEPELEIMEPPIFLVVESQPPHDVAAYDSGEILKYGRELRDRLLKLRSECRLLSSWPGACPNPMTMEPPAWARDDEGDGLDWEDA